jgi:hypothetical protein
MDWTIQTGSR